MLTKLTDRQVKMIVKNVIEACKNINKLTKVGYNYLYLASGFIAHYDLGGFIDYYSDNAKLVNDILNNENSNKWLNFRPGDKDYEYYHQKGEIYSLIIAEIKKEMLF
jgi:hypothetical protein